MSSVPKHSSQRRAVKMICILAGHEFEGLRPGELAKALGASPASISQDLRVLQDEGVVEPVPHIENRWRLGPKVIQIARAHQVGMDRVRSRLQEVDQRYSRSPR